MPEVERSLVVLVDEDRSLGRGAFGRVYLGRLHNVDNIDSKEGVKVTKVAVKLVPGSLLDANKAYALSEDAGADAQASLLHEVEIMSRIGRCVFTYFRRALHPFSTATRTSSPCSPASPLRARST